MSENLSDAENRERMQSAFVSLKRSLQSRARPDPPGYEMMQAYVNNTASELDREIIESYAELHPEFARELQDLQAFAAMMQEKEEIAESAGKPSFLERIASWLGLSSIWQLLSAAAASLLIAGTAVLVALQTAGTPQIAEIGNRAEPANPQVAQLANNNLSTGNDNRKANQNANRAPVEPEPQPAPPKSVFAFALPTVVRGDAPVLRIPANAGAVALQMRVNEEEAGKTFAARLVGPRGSVTLPARRAAKSGALVFTIPATQLPNGSYSLVAFKSPAEDSDVPYKSAFRVER